ncbi:MAG: glycoside hydrolase family 172 protein [Terricaulis silvestris]
MRRLWVVLAILALISAPRPAAAQAPYDLDALRNVQSRSITFENPTGAPGQGGQAASPLGPGRKGAPMRTIQAGERVQLADIAGGGTIRHIWMTTENEPRILRGTVIRVWWDGQAHPSIEAPLGDFFGFAHGRTDPFQSAVHSVGEKASLNIWLPMPFREHARVELVNESGRAMSLFYSIDYTIGDAHPASVGRLHIAFRRENPTTLMRDFEIMPHRVGNGRYIGAVIGVRPLGTPPANATVDWWGEGEFKAYIDGDTTLPTINGTGSEDYAGLSYGLQHTPYLYHGANWIEAGGGNRISMYRWHLNDPIVWHHDIRITMQQIGCCKQPPGRPWDYSNALWERSDDWSVAAFWYEPIPSAPLPPMPNAAARLADLPDAPK